METSASKFPHRRVAKLVSVETGGQTVSQSSTPILLYFSPRWCSNPRAVSVEVRLQNLITPEQTDRYGAKP